MIKLKFRLIWKTKPKLHKLHNTNTLVPRKYNGKLTKYRQKIIIKQSSNSPQKKLLRVTTSSYMENNFRRSR